MKTYATWVAEAITAHLGAANVKASLLGVGFTPPPLVTHQFRAEITGEIVPAGGYAPTVVTGLIAAYDDDAVRVRCDAIGFGEVTLTDIAGILLYVDSGDPATDTLIAIEVLEDPIDVTAEDLTYVPAATGFLAIGMS